MLRRPSPLLRQLAGRLMRFAVTLFLLITIVFFALHLAPGDPTDAMVSAGSTPEVLRAMRESMGIDKPLFNQYMEYLLRLSQGDLGVSWRNGVRISSQVANAFMHTFWLALAAMAVATLIGVCGGVASALTRGGWLDLSARGFALIGVSAPIFVINLLAIYFFAFKWPLFPTSGADRISALVLPAITLGAFVGAMMVRLVRTTTLEVLEQEYIRAARARGIPPLQLLLKHIAPNLLVVVVTMLGVQFGLLLGGSVITETVFAWPGLGQMTVQAIKVKDIPIVQGAVIVFSASFMLVTVAIDLLYPWLDPRITRSGP